MVGTIWSDVEVMCQYGAFGIPLKTHQYEHTKNGNGWPLLGRSSSVPLLSRCVYLRPFDACHHRQRSRKPLPILLFLTLRRRAIHEFLFAEKLWFWFFFLGTVAFFWGAGGFHQRERERVGRGEKGNRVCGRRSAGKKLLR